MLLEGVREFRRRLSDYLRFVRRRQEPVFITRHGRVVAALIPARAADMDEVERFCRIRKNRSRPITREEVIGRLRAVLPELRRRYGVRRLILFGSFARGEAAPDSDVDVVVDIPGGGEAFDLFYIQQCLEEVLGRGVEVATPAMVRHMRPSIEREGVVIDAPVEVQTS